MPRKRSAIRPSHRKAAIVEFVDRRGKASVEELAEKFSTSQETVRRDLKSLADAGRLRKVHGGVVRLSFANEGSFDERLAKHTLAKQLIAEKLGRYVLPGQSVFIDTGSTTLIGAKVLAKIPGLTIITNSVQIASEFTNGSGKANVILLGGTYRHDNAQTIGPTTIAEIGRFCADQAVLTVGTIDGKGVYDYSEDEAQVAGAMIDAAERVTVIADSSKLNKRSTFRVCELSQIDRLILDKTPDVQMLEALEFAGVELR